MSKSPTGYIHIDIKSTKNQEVGIVQLKFLSKYEIKNRGLCGFGCTSAVAELVNFLGPPLKIV